MKLKILALILCLIFVCNCTNKQKNLLNTNQNLITDTTDTILNENNVTSNNLYYSSKYSFGLLNYNLPEVIKINEEINIQSFLLKNVTDTVNLISLKLETDNVNNLQITNIKEETVNNLRSWNWKIKALDVGKFNLKLTALILDSIPKFIPIFEKTLTSTNTSLPTIYYSYIINGELIEGNDAEVNFIISRKYNTNFDSIKTSFPATLYVSINNRKHKFDAQREYLIHKNYTQLHWNIKFENATDTKILLNVDNNGNMTKLKPIYIKVKKSPYYRITTWLSENWQIFSFVFTGLLIPSGIKIRSKYLRFLRLKKLLNKLKNLTKFSLPKKEELSLVLEIEIISTAKYLTDKYEDPEIQSALYQIVNSSQDFLNEKQIDIKSELEDYYNILIQKNITFWQN